MVRAYAKERDNRRAGKAQKSGRPLDKAGQQKYAESLLDDELGKEIIDVNKTLADFASGNKVDYGTYDFQALLEELVKERKRRQGGKGTAGASKTQQPLEHMTNYGGKPLAEPGAGHIGSDAFNIQNFTEAADFGDLDTLIDNARPGKSGMWAFTEDPDPAIFSINGFLNRLSNPGHEANNVELVHLVKILAKAKKRKSMGNKNSMAEDLWTKIAGPTKELLRGFGFEL
jgi:hypothetical protein